MVLLPELVGNIEHAIGINIAFQFESKYRYGTAITQSDWRFIQSIDQLLSILGSAGAWIGEVCDDGKGVDVRSFPC